MPTQNSNTEFTGGNLRVLDDFYEYMVNDH